MPIDEEQIVLLQQEDEKSRHTQHSSSCSRPDLRGRIEDSRLVRSAESGQCHFLDPGVRCLAHSLEKVRQSEIETLVIISRAFIWVNTGEKVENLHNDELS